MDRIVYRVEPGAINVWTVAAFRLDGFTDEAAQIEWVTDNPAIKNDPAHKTYSFLQVPQGPALFQMLTFGGGFSAEADCIWSNDPLDVSLWTRAPGTFYSSFSGKRRTWTYGTDTWPDPIESTWRYFGAAVRLTAGGPGTFRLEVKALANPTRSPSTWKLASQAMY